MEKAIQCLWYKGLEKENYLIWVALFFKKKNFLFCIGVAQLVKNPSAYAGDPGLIPGSGRSAGEGIGCPLQYS